MIQGTQVMNKRRTSFSWFDAVYTANQLRGGCMVTCTGISSLKRAMFILHPFVIQGTMCFRGNPETWIPDAAALGPHPLWTNLPSRKSRPSVGQES